MKHSKAFPEVGLDASDSFAQMKAQEIALETEIEVDTNWVSEASEAAGDWAAEYALEGARTALEVSRHLLEIALAFNRIVAKVERLRIAQDEIATLRHAD